MKKTPIIALSLVVVAAVIVPPVFIKPSVQQQFSAWQEDVNQTPGYTLSIEPQDDGWFRSIYSAKLSYDTKLIDPEIAALMGTKEGLLTLPLTLSTSYGPLFFSDTFGIGTAKITAKADAQNLSEIIQWDKEQPFYQLEIVRGFDGDFTHKDRLVPFEASLPDSDETWVFDGYEGHGSYASGVLEHKAQFDRLALSGDFSVLLEGYTLDTRITSSLADLFSSTSYSYTMNNRIKSLSVADLLLIEDLQVATSNTLDETRKLNNATLTLASETVDLTDFGVLEELGLTVAINRISSEFLQHYNEALLNHQMVKGAEFDQTQLSAFINDNLALFLAPEPELNITEFTAQYEGHTFELGAHSHLEVGDDTDIQALSMDPEAWIPLIQADASLVMDQPFLESMVSSFVAPQLEPMLTQGHISREEYDTMMADTQQQIIGGFINQGLLEKRDDVYVSNFLMEKGVALLNGQAIN